jgi:hypothetical protein
MLFAVELKFIVREQFDSIAEMINETARVLSGLIRRLDGNE